MMTTKSEMTKTYNTTHTLDNKKFKIKTHRQHVLSLSLPPSICYPCSFIYYIYILTNWMNTHTHMYPPVASP